MLVLNIQVFYWGYKGGDTIESPIWQPSEQRIKEANMTRFIRLVNGRYGRNLASYDELRAWSLNNLGDSWALMWEFGEIKASRDYDTVITPSGWMIDLKWFQGAGLNFAENLLRYRDNRCSSI